MSNLIDLSDKIFERLKVIQRVYNNEKHGTYWECLCSCGNRCIVLGSALKAGNTKSCGCLNRELSARRKTTHGLSKHPLYTIWGGMKQRCNNPKNSDYPNYGGRGIYICEEWNRSFSKFLSDVGECPSDEYSLERRDTDGPYNPENCQWATCIEQCNNRQPNYWITYNEETKTLAEWSDIVNIPYKTLWWRIRVAEWSIEDAFTLPTSNVIEYEGKILRLMDWANNKKINVKTLKDRLRRGWSVERALTTPTLKKKEHITYGYTSSCVP